MTTYEIEIKEDTENISDYYPNAFQLDSNGKITLVSKKYIKWAEALVVEVNQHISIEKDMAEEECDNEKIKKNITCNQILYNLFNKAGFAKYALEDKGIRKFHTEIVVQVINARAGNVVKYSYVFCWSLFKE